MSINQNGQFILNTLVKINQPATAATIVSYVADITGVSSFLLLLHLSPYEKETETSAHHHHPSDVRYCGVV